MAFLATVELTKDWQDLETLIATQVPGFTWDPLKNYLFQGAGASETLFRESTTLPTNTSQGFLIDPHGQMKMHFKKQTANLYARAWTTSTLNIGTYGE